MTLASNGVPIETNVAKEVRESSFKKMIEDSFSSKNKTVENGSRLTILNSEGIRYLFI